MVRHTQALFILWLLWPMALIDDLAKIHVIEGYAKIKCGFYVSDRGQSCLVSASYINWYCGRMYHRTNGLQHMFISWPSLYTFYDVNGPWQ
jgi:hypothetical protein